MDLIQFVPEQLLVLVVALYIIGMMLKSTVRVPDWLIPWILLVVSITGSVALLGGTANAVIQGVICTGVAVYTNQLIKQTINK